MKLLTKTFRYYLIISIPIFILTSIGFYFLLRYVMIQQVDESLKEDKAEILSFIENDKDDVNELYKNITCSYYLKKLEGNFVLNDRYGFVYEYDYADQEQERYREYHTFAIINGENYEMVLQESFVETDSMIYSITGFSIFLFGLLTLGISFVYLVVSRNIWNPFYELLKLIKMFQPGMNIENYNLKSDIQEFTSLYIAFNMMAIRTNEDFDRQKKFIDNISHELQTPLAVASTQLELLIQKVMFDEKSAGIISELDSTFEKIKNINKSLLLLSQIKNRQFTDSEVIDIKRVVNRYIESHKEEIDIKEISILLKLHSTLKPKMNFALAEILIGNLLKNAIIHNNVGGEIVIETNDSVLTVKNSGDYLSKDKEQMVKNYIGTSKNSEQRGIGLSLVRQICDYYKIDFTYRIIGKIHVCKVKFNNDH